MNRLTFMESNAIKTALKRSLIVAISAGLMSSQPLVLSAQTTSPGGDEVSTPTRPGKPSVDVTPTRPKEPKNRQTDNRPDRNNDTISRNGERPTAPGLDPLITGFISDSLAAAEAECGKYDPVYRIDCLRQSIQLTASRLPNTGEYAQARQILRKAASRLGKIVSENADPEQPLLDATPTANPYFHNSRHYTAVKRKNLNSAMRQARAVVEEARTELLRSSENSERRYAHYQEIATAIGSTKVLLRSS